MNECRKCRDLMIDAIYGGMSAEDRSAFDCHLASCPGCAGEFGDMKAALDIFDRKVRPDPGQEFWDGYWDRLEKRLDGEASAVPAGRSLRDLLAASFRSIPRLAAGTTAAVVLVAFGVFLDRTVLKPRVSDVQTAQSRLFPETGPEIPVASADRAREYLERSKLIILGFVNYEQGAEETYGLDFPRQKRMSRELVQEAAFLKNELSSPANKRLHELVSDLETILVQIANLKSENDIPAVDVAIKQGVKSKGLLLKINLTEMEGL